MSGLDLNRFVEAFDGDATLTERVSALQELLAEDGRVTTRQLVADALVLGRKVSQSLVTRSMSVARTLADTGIAVDGLDSRTVANMVRIVTESKSGGGVKALAAIVKPYTAEVREADDWRDMLAADVDAAWSLIRGGNAPAAQVDESAPDTSEGTDDLGAGEPDGGAIGGGESAVITAERAAEVVRAIAGDVNTGRIDASDELEAAAEAILKAIAGKRAAALALTATA